MVRHRVQHHRAYPGEEGHVTETPMGSGMSAFDQEMMCVAGASVCAGWSCIYDVRERRIPNRITFPALLAGIALHAMFGGWAGLANSLGAALLGGGIFLMLYLAGGLGAGDVKLMAAVGCFVGVDLLPSTLLWTVGFGAVASLGVALYRGRLLQTFRNVAEIVTHHGRKGIVPHPELNLANEATLRLPYALPVAAGCAVVACSLMREGHL